MKREYIVWGSAVVVLLAVGMVVGKQHLTPVQAEHAGTFRYWFWQNRSLDLAVQLGLVFVGALGISALLPRDRHDG